MHTRRPHIDAASLATLHEAIELLALLRGICCPIADPDDDHNPVDALHLAWSISLQIDACLPNLIAHAHQHGYSWNDIRDCFDPAPAPTR